MPHTIKIKVVAFNQNLPKMGRKNSLRFGKEKIAQHIIAENFQHWWSYQEFNCRKNMQDKYLEAKARKNVLFKSDIRDYRKKSCCCFCEILK